MDEDDPLKCPRLVYQWAANKMAFLVTKKDEMVQDVSEVFKFIRENRVGQRSSSGCGIFYIV